MDTIRRFIRVDLRDQLVDDFFEYCLISRITNEDDATMQLLSRGQEVQLKNGWRIKTKDFFINQDEPLTPTLWISSKSETIIVDAYNGARKQEISRRIQRYKEAFQTDRVYVFSSGVSSFQFHGAQKEEENICVDSHVVSITEINKQYLQELIIFKEELDGWKNQTVVMGSVYRE